MAKQVHPMEALRPYLPEGSFEPVMAYLDRHQVQLTITRKRRTVLGDYRLARTASGKLQHQISVNGDLNPFAFLVTLLHELAHLVVQVSHHRSIEPHGREWQAVYRQIMLEFLELGVFPASLEKVIQSSMQRPAASSCADLELYRALRAYDPGFGESGGQSLLENLQPGQVFRVEGGRRFRFVAKMRKRIRCDEIPSGRSYLFSPVYQVWPE
jgi:hypothetical protein